MTEAERLERVLAALPEDPERAARLVDSVGGAPAVLEAARQYGLSVLVAHYLPATAAVPAPELLAAKFRTAQLLRVLRKALGVIQAEGIQALALKGVGLAARFYPAIWLRPTSDADLLVRPGDLERASAALRQAGYREFQGPAESAFDFHHHCSFSGPSKELVEVHFTPACGFQSQFDVEAIFGRATQVEVEGGPPLPVMGLEDALVHMCTHAAHHRFEGVKWLFDLKLLALGQRVDWALATRLAKQAHVAAAVGMAMAESERRVRAPFPKEIIEALAPGLARRLLARRASQIPGVGIYPLSLVLADTVTVRWVKELAARPIERTARWAGREKEFRALVRTVLGIDERW